MRRYRHALCRVAATVVAGAATIVALPTTASAAPPKPTCNLMVDAVGDGASLDTDVVSGDIASDATVVVAQLRLRSLTPDAMSATGARWTLGFPVGSAYYEYGLRRDALGTLTATFTRQVPDEGGPVVVAIPMTTYDPARRAITWRVTRASIPELPATPDGALLGGFTAWTYTSPADFGSDAAFGNAYPDGNPSCLRL
jgi:hypothetical protein